MEMIFTLSYLIIYLICGVCVCVHMHVQYMFVHLEARGRYWVLSALFFEIGSLTEPGASQSDVIRDSPCLYTSLE